MAAPKHCQRRPNTTGLNSLEFFVSKIIGRCNLKDKIKLLPFDPFWLMFWSSSLNIQPHECRLKRGISVQEEKLVIFIVAIRAVKEESDENGNWIVNKRDSGVIGFQIEFIIQFSVPYCKQQCFNGSVQQRYSP